MKRFSSPGGMSGSLRNHRTAGRSPWRTGAQEPYPTDPTGKPLRPDQIPDTELRSIVESNSSTGEASSDPQAMETAAEGIAMTHEAVSGAADTKGPLDGK
ncbi:hypothetical protein [Ruegeria arenilitoris]|uniref:hypothetical protein n=1 Tax=Ruegeria arenilitoris TaxID=1173585 RepID=UPI00147B7EE3|nr:hypothetical protein [Ruegeria arenilitoris]